MLKRKENKENASKAKRKAQEPTKKKSLTLCNLINKSILFSFIYIDVYI
jgi:hypothetical protein